MEAQQVINRWDAEEQVVRARLTRPGTATPEQIVGRTGMEMFEAIFSGELPPAPIGNTLDFVPIHMAPGTAVFQGRPQRRHYNPLGAVHGGRQVATAEGRIVGPDGKLYAHATTTCLIFDQPATT